uniref:venom peptide isomerase heavy chain-like n=1 Tax=Osmia lignaria TaxID=473952 RepID=UPI0014787F89|nr:venom peptide isomerase heavy chain-like [Osmia lignaria]
MVLIHSQNECATVKKKLHQSSLNGQWKSVQREELVYKLTGRKKDPVHQDVVLRSLSPSSYRDRHLISILRRCGTKKFHEMYRKLLIILNFSLLMYNGTSGENISFCLNNILFNLISWYFSTDMMSYMAMLAQRPARIVGGKDAEKGLHPWQVSVHWGDRERKIPARHICGGSLLTAGWILTAGHCKTLTPSRGEFLILAGKYKLGVFEDTEQSRLVDKVFVHPEYDGTVAPYDIALMQVEKPFDLNPFVSTVSLPYPGSIPTGDVMLTGWGSIGRTRAPEKPENLQAALLPIIDYDLCKSTLDKSLKGKEKNPLHSTNVCTGPLDGSLSACKVQLNF